MESKIYANQYKQKKSTPIHIAVKKVDFYR